MHDYELLIEKFINKSISQKEREVLNEWVLANDVNKNIFEKRIYNSVQKSSFHFDANSGYERFISTIDGKKETSKSFSLRIIKYAAACVILLIIGVIAKKELNLKKSLNAVHEKEQFLKNNNIVITSSDGTIKIIDEKGKEFLLDSNGNHISKKLIATTDISKKMYNEISIPLGRTYKLFLSDSTLVWLNSGTKFKYPQKFNNSDQKRLVHLEGEAFFDVTKNTKQPFILSTNDLDVKVVGTSFNVSSYNSDKSVTTTLVEGAVSLYDSDDPEISLELTPSFQARYDKENNNFKKTKVDTSIYTAWMENRLIIDNLTFKEILTKLERKHDVKFINEIGDLNGETFKGEFVNEDIEFIMNTIAMTSFFKFKIDNNIIKIYEEK